jgi:hypothetical protein
VVGQAFAELKSSTCGMQRGSNTPGTLNVGENVAPPTVVVNSKRAEEKKEQKS